MPRSAVIHNVTPVIRSLHMSLRPRWHGCLVREGRKGCVHAVRLWRSSFQERRSFIRDYGVI